MSFGYGRLTGDTWHDNKERVILLVDRFIKAFKGQLIKYVTSRGEGIKNCQFYLVKRQDN